MVDGSHERPDASLSLGSGLADLFPILSGHRFQLLFFYCRCFFLGQTIFVSCFVPFPQINKEKLHTMPRFATFSADSSL